MKATGIIIDRETNRPIPSVSIVLCDELGVPTQTGFVGNSAGEFSVSGQSISSPNSLLFTSVGYIGTIVKLDYSDMLGLTIPLEKDIQTLTPVVVTGSKKDNTGLLLLLALGVAIASQKKKSVGEVKPEHVITGALVVAGLMAFGLINDLLAKFGLGQGAGGAQAQDEVENPQSAWKPSFLAYIPAGQSYQLITRSAAEKYAKRIQNAFTVVQDNYNEIMSVFGNLKTKSQVSFLAKVFDEMYGQDLLTFLRDGGGILPWDGLSDDHLEEITNLVDNFPQYNFK